MDSKMVVQQQEFHRKWARLWVDVKRRCTTAQTRHAVQRQIDHHVQRLGELIWLERRAGESGWLDAVS